jgi:hypothetical protein
MNIRIPLFVIISGIDNITNDDSRDVVWSFYSFDIRNGEILGIRVIGSKVLGIGEV